MLKKTTFFGSMKKYKSLKYSKVNQFHQKKVCSLLLEQLTIGKISNILIEKRKQQKCQKKKEFGDLIRDQIENCYCLF